MTTLSKALVPWKAAPSAPIPKGITAPADIIDKYGIALRDPDKKALLSAFKSENYGMGAGHLWRRTISKLRARLARLGMQFLGEMLNRSDISDGSIPEAVLTDHDTIYLAEALGFVDATGAMRLRQGFELVVHFDSDKASDEMSVNEATSVVKACIQYVIGVDDSSSAIDFTRFRERLSSEGIDSKDPALDQLLDSPLFYIRTVLRVLLAGAKIEDGAKLEHSLANLNTVLPNIWSKLTDDDKWSVGSAFAELSNYGNRPQAISGVRTALLRVKGFDFVPENLRSSSFKRAAQAALNAHYSFNNYAAEIEPTKQLVAMGTSIPVPALAECLKAYLCIYLGNSFGFSWEAAPLAECELRNVSVDRWRTYFSKVFTGEENVLYKLCESKPRVRWIELSKSLNFSTLELPPGTVKKLIDATVKGADAEILGCARTLIQNYKGVDPKS